MDVDWVLFRFYRRRTIKGLYHDVCRSFFLFLIEKIYSFW